MKIVYANPVLEPYLTDDKLCRKTYGEKMRKKIRRRLADAEAANHMGVLRKPFPGKWHGPLSGNRKGQFSTHLEEPARLIFVPYGNPAEYTNSGTVVWEKVKAIKIIEIEPNYHE